MTSTTFSDNRTQGFFSVLLWQFRRCLPLGAFYLAALLVSSVILFAQLPSQAVWMPCSVTLVMALLLPAFQFGDCFSRRQSDFFHALPVSRSSYFWAAFLSSLLWLWGPLFPAMGLRGLLYALSSGIGPLHDVVDTLLFLLILSGACLSLFTLAAVGSGSYLGYGKNVLLLSLCWPACAMAFSGLISSTVPRAVYPRESTRFLHMLGSPPLSIPVFFPSQDHPVPGWQLLWWAIFTVLTALAGCFLYRRRKSEASGSLWTAKPLEYVIRTLLGAAAACFMGAFVSSLFRHPYTLESMSYLRGWGVPLALGAMVFALAAAWFLTELLYHLGPKKLARHWPFLAAPAALSLLLAAVMSTGMGLDTALPRAEDVKYASIDLPSANSFTVPVAASGGEDLHESLLPVFSSREQVEKVLELKKKGVELERAGQFPYLPGRDSYGPISGSGTDLFLDYRLKDNGYFYWDISFCSQPTERAKALFQEIQDMTEELLASEEYVSGLFPVCAIDAAGQIGKATLREQEVDPEDPYADPYFAYTYYTDVLCGTAELPKNAKSIDSLPGNFREQLEKALRDDLSQGRCPSSEEIAEKYGGGKSTEIYEIYYPSGRSFTARGGIVESTGEPAAGRKWTLSDYNTPEVGPLTTTFRVLPEMTETYALLKAQYEGK